MKTAKMYLIIQILTWLAENEQKFYGLNAFNETFLEGLSTWLIKVIQTEFDLSLTYDPKMSLVVRVPQRITV